MNLYSTPFQSANGACLRLAVGGSGVARGRVDRGRAGVLPRSAARWRGREAWPVGGALPGVAVGGSVAGCACPACRTVEGARGARQPRNESGGSEAATSGKRRRTLPRPVTSLRSGAPRGQPRAADPAFPAERQGQRPGRVPARVWSSEKNALNTRPLADSVGSIDRHGMLDDAPEYLDRRRSDAPSTLLGRNHGLT